MQRPNLPAILEPNFDLLWLDVCKNRTLSDQLLPSQRARFWALGVNSFERFHLLRRVSDILAGIKVLVDAATAAFSMVSHSHRHLPKNSKFCIGIRGNLILKSYCLRYEARRRRIVFFIIESRKEKRGEFDKSSRRLLVGKVKAKWG